MVLLLGVGTQLRVRDAVAEDVWLVLGMNRLRHAYLELAPDLEPYFVTSQYDDERGVMQNYGPWATVRPSRLLASTPVLIDAVIEGVIAGFVAEILGGSRTASILVGVAVTLVALALLVLSASHVIQEIRTTYVPRFPRPAP